MNNMPKIRLISALTAVFALTGCAVGPDYLRPTASLPTAYTEAAPAATQSQVETAWWTHFQDPILNDLVDQALNKNADIRTALARVEQAAAVARESGAAFFPQIDADVGGTNRKLSMKTATWSANSKQRIDTRSAALTTSYELDLWGRIRRSNEAAQASLLASQYSRDAIRLTIAGLISNNYLA